MAQLTGINNCNEFYSNHYLEAILTDDLKDVIKKWKEQAQFNQEKTPPEKLASGAKDYFKILDQFANLTEVQDRFTLQHQWLETFLELLGYDFKPQLKPLDQSQVLPIIAEVKKDNGSPFLCVVECLNDRKEQDKIDLSAYAKTITHLQKKR